MRARRIPRRARAMVNKRTVSRVGSLVIFVLAGLIFAEEYWHVWWGYEAAVAIFGVGTFLGGLVILHRGEAIEGRQEIRNPRAVARFTGASALLIGILMLLAGPAMAAFAAMSIVTGEKTSELLASLADSAAGLGAILGVAGALATIVGIVRLRSGTGTSDYFDEVPEMGIRVGGAITAVVGMVLVVAAAGLLFAPDLVQDAVSRIAAPFGVLG